MKRIEVAILRRFAMVAFAAFWCSTSFAQLEPPSLFEEGEEPMVTSEPEPVPQSSPVIQPETQADVMTPEDSGDELVPPSLDDPSPSPSPQNTSDVSQPSDPVPGSSSSGPSSPQDPTPTYPRPVDPIPGDPNPWSNNSGDPSPPGKPEKETPVKFSEAHLRSNHRLAISLDRIASSDGQGSFVTVPPTKAGDLLVVNGELIENPNAEPEEGFSLPSIKKNQTIALIVAGTGMFGCFFFLSKFMITSSKRRKRSRDLRA
jgi:hypothetical protein